MINATWRIKGKNGLSHLVINDRVGNTISVIIIIITLIALLLKIGLNQATWLVSRF